MKSPVCMSARSKITVSAMMGVLNSSGRVVWSVVPAGSFVTEGPFRGISQGAATAFVCDMVSNG